MIRHWMCAALSLLLLSSVGCGTLTSGTTQDLQLTFEPTDATVNLYRLDGEHVVGPSYDGVTTIPRLTHFVPYLSVVSHDGHCPAYGITKVDATPGYTANSLLLLFPGINLIGLVMIAVDSNTGGCCTIAPIVAELPEDTACE